ncbi:hypothetical protein EI94DRAFT_1057638 [Lactarius quietus]|nr:hypothetical protein EI94DRAFT_1057638 [Lactarius quietus]
MSEFTGGYRVYQKEATKEGKDYFRGRQGSGCGKCAIVRDSSNAQGSRTSRCLIQRPQCTPGGRSLISSLAVMPRAGQILTSARIGIQSCLLRLLLLTHGGDWCGEPVSLPCHEAQEPAILCALCLHACEECLRHQSRSYGSARYRWEWHYQAPYNLSRIPCLLYVVDGTSSASRWVDADTEHEVGGVGAGRRARVRGERQVYDSEKRYTLISKRAGKEVTPVGGELSSTKSR